MGHQGAGSVAEGGDQLHDVLREVLDAVVLLVGGPLRVPVAPHVDGHHPVVLAELTQLVAPGEPELRGEREVGKSVLIRRALIRASGIPRYKLVSIIPYDPF